MKDQLKTFHSRSLSRSLSRLQSVDESDAEPEERKITKLQAAIIKKGRQLESEVGNLQLWQFSGGCCCCLYPCGLGSWSGEALYRRDPSCDPSVCLASMGLSFINSQR
jgi:hypothetical protein